MCFIEDRRSISLVTPTPHLSHRWPPFIIDGEVDRTDRGLTCSNVRLDELISPRIDLYEIERVGLNNNRFRIKGTVEGVCLSEAGVFERGRKTIEIGVKQDRDLTRSEFSVVVNPDLYPEIRVYNVLGGRDLIRIDPDSYKKFKDHSYGSGKSHGGYR